MESTALTSTSLLFINHLLGLSQRSSPGRLRNSLKEIEKQIEGSLGASEEMTCVRARQFLFLLKNQLVVFLASEAIWSLLQLLSSADTAPKQHSRCANEGAWPCSNKALYMAILI